jgi:hypothetical protein
MYHKLLLRYNFWSSKLDLDPGPIWISIRNIELCLQGGLETSHTAWEFSRKEEIMNKHPSERKNHFNSNFFQLLGRKSGN